MKKNILAENMRRFRTKNLNEITYETTWMGLDVLPPHYANSKLNVIAKGEFNKKFLDLTDEQQEDIINRVKGHSTAGQQPSAATFDIHVNYVQIDTNFHDITMQTQGTLDSHFLEEVLGDLEAYLEDQNITGDDGHPSFDITRFVSDIKLDCEIKMGKDEIDLTIELDPDGSIKYVNIGDEPLAEKYGITDESVMKHLEAKGI